MLATAIEALHHEDRSARVVTPTKKPAQVAAETLKVPADSVDALVYAHGFRWNDDGVFTRLKSGDPDPTTGRIYTGPPREARLVRGERVIVDEAGMLDQDTALALLTVVREARASVALVGDRTQLPAVGRGGVLDMAAHIREATVDMSELHRFADDQYAALTLRMREGKNPAAIFDQLHAMDLVRLHADDDAMREHIAEHTIPEDAVTVATNDEATARAHEASKGLVKDGPVSMVMEELARLDGLAEKAAQRAAWWEQVGEQLAALSARHREETDESSADLATAEEHAATVRAETVAPLEARAEAEGREYLDAVGEEAQAAGRLATAGWFGKRRAQREHDTAREHTQALRGRLSSEWVTLPRHANDLHAWAERVAAQRTEEAPEVVGADEAVVDARQARTGLQERQRRARLALLARFHGVDNVRRDPDRYLRTSPRRQAAKWRASVEEARAEAAELRGLSPDQAVYLIGAKRTAAEAREAALRDRQRQLPTSTSRTPLGARPVETDQHAVSRRRAASPSCGVWSGATTRTTGTHRSATDPHNVTAAAQHGRRHRSRHTATCPCRCRGHVASEEHASSFSDA